MSDRWSNAAAPPRGLLIPLFSCPSAASWGIGDIGDIAPLRAWLDGAGQRVLQLLPLNEMAPGQQSPYSAISAMAIDPHFIRAADGAGVRGARRRSGARRRAIARALDAVARGAAHRLRGRPRAEAARAARAPSSAFSTREWRARHERARALRAVRRASRRGGSRTTRCSARCTRASSERPWTEWPRGAAAPRAGGHRSRAARARRRSAVPAVPAVDRRRRSGASARDARAHGVGLFGDLPFMVDGDSADVWARQDQFRLDASVGAPPDAFSATGQDWGMPVYVGRDRRASDYRWLRERARRSADLYDGYRVDHLVGFYRTYGRPQRRRRRRSSRRPTSRRSSRSASACSSCSASAGAEIIAEDLGTVPDFVRASLARLGVPGFRVFRWERHWHADGQPFRDPRDYPRRLGGHLRHARHRADGRLVGDHNRVGTSAGQGAENSWRYCRVWRYRRRGSRLSVAGVVGVGITTRAVSCAGRFRLARTHQRAGDGQRLELDVSSAVALQSSRRSSPRAAVGPARLDRTASAHIISKVATLRPFRALRPTARNAAAIAAVPYDVVSTEEARALADGNPLSFLRVSRAELELPPSVDPYSPAVYERAAENFSRVRESMVVEDRAESLLLQAADGPSRADGARRVLVGGRVPNTTS